MLKNNELYKIFSKIPATSIPFWSLNNELDKDELVKEIRHMHKVGYGGFVFHARTGLQTEYLGEKWFDCVAASLAEAKKLGMEAWIYDENGWPSGFVGGKLLENVDFRARFLEMKITDNFDPDAYCAFVKVDDTYKYVAENIGKNQYYCIYLRISPANSDILNPDVVAAFILETHEKYYERFKESFGKELVGFFTDEPQYYRWATPFTPSLENYFAERGVDLKQNLIWLFVHDNRGYEFRTQYYRRLNYLYNNVYYKTLYEWCDSHNCKLTGHSVEESTLAFQMYGGAGVMGSYEFEHIPGIDNLGRICATELAPKQLGSVASQLGFAVTLTESYGCSGYDTTLYEFKSLGDYQFFNGVSKMCQHLYPMSISKQGKYDHPPIFSAHIGLDEEFKQFNTYFDRLGYVVSHTKEQYDVAVIHPLRNVYLEYVRDEDAQSVQDLENDFFELLADLRKNGVMFQFVDETLFEKYGGVTKDGNLKMGNNVYSTVIVPKMQSISRSVLNALQNFKGNLLALSKLNYVDGNAENVELQSNTTFEQIVVGAQVFYRSDGNSFITSRVGDLGEFLFVKNLSISEKSQVTLRPSKNFAKLDLITCELSSISEDFTLQAGEGIVLMQTDEKLSMPQQLTKQTDITQKFKITHISDNWLTLDYAQLSFDGKNFAESKPIQQIFEDLLRLDYKGNIFVRQTFCVKDVNEVTLLVEQQNYSRFTLNGKDIQLQQSQFDMYFSECCLKNLQNGQNVLEYEMYFWQHDGVHFALFDPLATESLRNCLAFDTSIENCYLKGNFVLDENYCLNKPREIPLTSLMYKNGYPFFFGTLEICGEIECRGGAATLDLTDGRFAACKVFVNGNELPFVFDGKFDIAPFAHIGKNEVKIVLNSSMRNLMGPHHFKPDPEPMGVSPICFTMRGTWGDGVSPMYTHNYNFVPFGINKIVMLES